MSRYTNKLQLKGLNQVTKYLLEMRLSYVPLAQNQCSLRL